MGVEVNEIRVEDDFQGIKKARNKVNFSYV
jgi:hypothetical protein